MSNRTRPLDPRRELITEGLPPKVVYANLDSKQKEIYNFQKVAGRLADYGFNCIKLSDDWNGADFLAYHRDADTTLRIQLKARVTISKSYVNKGLHLAFLIKSEWYIVEHDRLVEIVGETTPWLTTESWLVNGLYSSAAPSAKLRSALAAYRLD